MVITNMVPDKTGLVAYFQVYERRGRTMSFLDHSMPWSTEKGAIDNFNQWVTQTEQGVDNSVVGSI